MENRVSLLVKKFEMYSMSVFNNNCKPDHLKGKVAGYSKPPGARDCNSAPTMASTRSSLENMPACSSSASAPVDNFDEETDTTNFLSAATSISSLDERNLQCCSSQSELPDTDVFLSAKNTSSTMLCECCSDSTLPPNAGPEAAATLPLDEHADDVITFFTAAGVEGRRRRCEEVHVGVQCTELFNDAQIEHVDKATQLPSVTESPATPSPVQRAAAKLFKSPSVTLNRNFLPDKFRKSLAPKRLDFSPVAASCNNAGKKSPPPRPPAEDGVAGEFERAFQRNACARIMHDVDEEFRRLFEDTFGPNYTNADIDRCVQIFNEMQR